MPFSILRLPSTRGCEGKMPSRQPAGCRRYINNAFLVPYRFSAAAAIAGA
jgi:hypothetical protein